MNSNNLEKWKNEEEDEYEEEDEEMKRNENPLPELQKEFRDNVLQAKHSLYDNIVISPAEGTPNAQNNQLLQDYLDKLNQLYVLSIRAENGKMIPDEALLMFPEGSKQVIRFMLDSVSKFFKENQFAETIPYTSYLRKSLHDYQFVQDNSFEDD